MYNVIIILEYYYKATFKIFYRIKIELYKCGIRYNSRHQFATCASI